MKFDTILGLEWHVETNHEETVPLDSEPFPCDVCGIVLTNFLLLNEHTRTFHMTSQNPENFPCNSCNIKFDTKLCLD